MNRWSKDVPLHEAMLLAAAIGHFALAIVAARLSAQKNSSNVLARPLAILCFDIFAFNFATFAGHQFGGAIWRNLDAFASALAPVFVLHLVLTFVGKRREFRRILCVFYIYFGLLALSSAVGASWIESDVWSLVFLLGWAPSFVFELVLLVRHLAKSNEAIEQARTRVFLAALFVGGALASTDVWHDVGVPVPALGALGSLIATFLVLLLTFRFRFFDRNVSWMTGLYVTLLGAGGLVLYLVMFRAAGEKSLASSRSAFAFGALFVTLLLSLAARELASSFARYRERTDRLAILGRFSAQMGHDLKNPLAALIGATSLFEHDAVEGSSSLSVDQRREFAALIIEQAKRVGAIVDRYERISRFEPHIERVDVDEVVKRIASIESAGRGTKIDVVLKREHVICDADPDLLAGVVENLVHNARDAAGAEGAIQIIVDIDDETRRAIISVHDNGRGMDARTLERAFDDFFTTKSSGSGLGLAFVRRVLIAHGGDAAIESELAKGTRVITSWPITRASQ